MASVKVAVRVRPLNRREIDLDAKVIINMDSEGKKTSIVNPHISSDIKDFSYDHSYWSADSRDRHFATQEQVFSDLGKEVINSAFEGYNACIFAYGQTGAGKSYTMMGMQESIGLIPRICEGMYEKMSKDQAEHKIEFKSEVSYIEIYNERVRDLLRPTPKKGDAYNLKVREHPKDGPYVQDLTKHIVAKYSDIEKLMDIGNSHRTTASTNMNDTSSRSHAIFTLNFTQAKFYTDMPSETVSKINLVDLAGSERANSTGATGQRLKEGANINKSLVTLGTVISNLAEASSAHDHSKKRPFIPYRDSVLTWLLKDSLGGNAKTIMIAAISPADVNYSETLSTLRYANRAKNIMNKPTVNEDPNVKLIRELRGEIEKLRVMLSATNQGNSGDVAMNVDETRVVERISENQAKVDQLTRDWNNKWKETQKIMEERALAFRREGFGVRMESDLPYLVCVDDDILSTGVTLYHLRDGRTHVGGENANVKQDIILHGPGIESQHCVIESIESSVTLHPIAEDCFINGSKIKKATRLSQGAVVLLGKTNMFRFNHPAEAAKLRQKYASVENLASIVPSKELEARSYLFYNAGLEMERRHREEAKILDDKRKELEKKQAEDAVKLEEARREIEKLKFAKQEEEKIQLEVQETQRHLEEQRRNLQLVKDEQEKARLHAQKELDFLKDRIRKEHEDEKTKLDEEMQRLLAMKELHQKSVVDKEMELVKQREELSKKWEEEKSKIEDQRKEVLRLQNEFDSYREKSRKKDLKEEECEEKKVKAMPVNVDELRKLLSELEKEYDDEVKTAHIEILQAKEAVKAAEIDTLQGKRGLAQGKSQLQSQWKKLESIQTMHKHKQIDLQRRIKEVKEELNKAEEAEEKDLMEQGQNILERKKKRRKVEEATQKLLEMESKFSKIDTELVESKDLVDWQQREEIRELGEHRKILMELLSKHQLALLKASQMVTETKTKLDNHLGNEKTLVDPIKSDIIELEKELEPLSVLEGQINRKCENIDKDMKERKKVLYKQRKRINLLEKQLAQSSGPEPKAGLDAEELEDFENEREAEWELIKREKALLFDMEEKYRHAQDHAELQIGDACQSLEKKKMQVTVSLNEKKKKLEELLSVHQETTVYIEAELEARNDMLQRVKEKVINDKKELAKLDMKKQASAEKAAEELFAMAEMLEKDLSEKGNKEELAKIRDHRKKLQDLDRQLRIAERKEKFGSKDADDANCVIL
eukprot:gene19956-21910_t